MKIIVLAILVLISILTLLRDFYYKEETDVKFYLMLSFMILLSARFLFN